MKKLLVLCLSLLLIFFLAACGDKDGGEALDESDAAQQQSADDEALTQLKALYDGQWINEDPYDGPFTLEVVSPIAVKVTYPHTPDALHCDLFYSGDNYTEFSISLSGLSLGQYSLDTATGILTHKPNEYDVFTYKKEL